MIKKLITSIFIVLSYASSITAVLAQSTAAILPQGKTQFLDNNGNPLSSGRVYFYIPSTTTFKTTWQDAAKTIANTNPVILDAGGRAIIYGDGTYRQQVRTSANTLIYDVVTASAGTGGGITGTGDGDLVGTVKPWAGLIAPNQYAFAYGQEISRTTYSVLFTALTLNQTVTCASGSPTLTGMSDTTQIPVGSVIETNCVAPGSTVLSKTTTTVTLNNNASLNTSTSAVFFLYGNGNGSTTFNLPDLRGAVVAGRCNMGGTACTNLTTAGLGETPEATGAQGGASTRTLVTGNLPPYTPAGTTSGSVSIVDSRTWSWNRNALNNVAGGGIDGSVGQSAGAFVVPVDVAGSITGSITNLALTGTAQGGTSSPISIVQPTITLNYIIKITPDSNSADASGVTSIQGMTGDIACGTGLTCTGNIISALTSLPQANLFVGNSTNVAEATTPKKLGVLYAAAYGVTCDSVTDDTAAIIAADAAAATATAKLVFPGGGCKVSSELTPSTGAYWEGSSFTSTAIVTNSATANVLNITNSFVTIDNIQIGSSVSRTAGSFYNIDSSNITLIKPFATMTGIGTVITLGASTNTLLIEAGTFTGPATGGGTMIVNGCLNCMIRQLTFKPNAAPTDYHISLNSVGDFTCIDCNVLGAASGVIVQPTTGQAVVSTHFIGGYIDGPTSFGMRIIPTGTGAFARSSFIGVGFTSAVTIGVQIAPQDTSSISGIKFSNSDFSLTTTGISAIKGTGTIDGLIIVNSSFSGETLGAEFDGVTRLNLFSNIFGAAGGSGNTTNGVTFTGTMTDTQVSYNTFNVTGTAVTNTATGISFGPNAGYNPYDFPTGLVQGDILYGSATGVFSRLAKNASATRYLSNTGASNNPAWAQIDLSNGVTNRLSFSNLTQGATNTVLSNATSGTADFAAFAMPSCSTASSALIWTTNTGFGCNSSITANAIAVGGITGLGAGIATWLATPSSANLATAVTGETGTAGGLVFSISPTFTGTLSAAIITTSGNITLNSTTATMTVGALAGTANNSLVIQGASGSNFGPFMNIGDGTTNHNFGFHSAIIGGTSKAFTILVGNGGGAVPLEMYVNGSTRWQVDTSGNWVGAGSQYIQGGVTTVGALPACAAGTKAARLFVTDSNAASYTAGIGAIVAAGGATNVPVICDGTNWRIG